MKILVIGSGGREHALVWKIAQSPKVSEIFCAPGNAGISQLATNINIASDDILGLRDFAIKNKIDLTVVGPEAPLVAGIVDDFNSHGLKIYGPSKEAALLEGSKVFSKNIMKKYNIPTAQFGAFTDESEAKKYLKTIKSPVVVKVDGLAAGKGVIICKTEHDAEKAIELILREKEFGDAGNEIIIEECLIGEEASILCFADGKTILPMASAQDHKRIFDNDEGPNTGGMGAYSPAPIVTPQLLQIVDEKILKPTMKAMEAEGSPYSGVLYVGLMITKDGPKVLEYNARFGDPETQCILPRLKNDLIDIMLTTLDLDSKLHTQNLTWDPRPAVCVVLAAGGYPGAYKKGDEIKGLDEARELDDVIVFHAGTKVESGKSLDRARDKSKVESRIVTNGGRVLNIVGFGQDIKSAIDRAYEAIKLIHFDGIQYRKDIGRKAFIS